MSDISIRAQVDRDAVQRIMDRKMHRMSKVMRDAVEHAGRAAILEPLREQMRRAFPNSRKLPTTWRMKVYPEGDSLTLEPAAYVYSNADHIVQAFDKGLTIRPKGGKRFLWIPTENVPTTTGGAKRKPRDMQARLGKWVFLPARNGRYIASIEVEAKGAPKRQPRGGKTLKPRLNFKRPTKAGRASGNGLVRLVAFYILVPQITLRKRLDVAAVRAKAPAAFAARVKAEIARLDSR